ncbi:radical SAM protein [Amycolatopsis nigrescens]|uniref:radical SAM protein n=1 Tax=Amycolatopsis nigrescens TaxID=381445 RepID=UPI0003630122|nr:radical SAM protein [Amycolatopsis nigrescens]
MKVLLVNPNVLTPEVFPAGMEYTAEHLIREDRHDISILDMNVSDEIDASVRHQDLVLMGVRNVDSGMDNEAPELPLIRSIVERFRQVYTGPIGIAGSAVNLSPEGVRDYLGIEYALVSKGFGAVDQLLANLDKDVVPPGIIRDYSRCVGGEFERNVIDKAFYLKDGGRIGVATKFGCPFRCQHCDYPAIDGRVITMRPPQEVVEEVRNLHRAGVDKIFFADAQFNLPVKHAIAILEGLLDEDLNEVDWDGFINPHKAAFNERLAHLYKRFGKEQVHFGIDSLSNRVLRELRKGFTVDDVRNAVRMCREHDMEVSCSLLFGSPSETLESVRETFQHIDEIGFNYVDVSPRIRIYPETPLYEIAVEQGIVPAGDPLLHPVFYPVAREVLETVFEMSDARPECHAAGLVQYFSFDEIHLPTEGLKATGGAALREQTAIRVKTVMARILDLAVSPEQIQDDQSLYTSVIGLDSIGLLQVLVALEAEFACHIDDEDVMAADLKDVASLVRLVEDKLAGER